MILELQSRIQAVDSTKFWLFEERVVRSPYNNEITAVEIQGRLMEPVIHTIDGKSVDFATLATYRTKTQGDKVYHDFLRAISSKPHGCMGYYRFPKDDSKT